MNDIQDLLYRLGLVGLGLWYMLGFGPGFHVTDSLIGYGATVLPLDLASCGQDLYTVQKIKDSRSKAS